MFAFRKILMLFSLVRLDAFQPPNQSTSPTFPPNDENNASYPPNQENNISYPPNQNTSSSFSPNQENSESYSPNQNTNPTLSANEENNVSYPPNRNTNPTLSPNKENNVSYPPNQEKSVSYPPNQNTSPTLSPNQENSVSYPPNQNTSPTLSTNQENNVSYPANQENSVSYPPNQENNVSYPPNQNTSPTLTPNLENNVSYPSNQNTSPTLTPNQKNNVSYPPNQNTNSTLMPNQDILAPRSPDNVDTMLRRVCPGVDICRANSSSSKLAPNEILEGDSLVSCCQGCSCHKDCHQTGNYCYKDDATPDLDTQPLDECMYIQTGPPDTAWPSRVPAYRIVTAPPTSGCRDPANIHQGLEGSSNASCGQEYGVAWRNFYPVYSREKDTIYKNANCASCHGATDLVPWQPLLLCDTKTDREVSLAEQFQFLEQKTLSEHCSLHFQYPDRQALRHKLCYIQYESSCQKHALQVMGELPYGIKLTKEEIVRECETGMASPVNLKRAVYKNIFCALCNVFVKTSLLCDSDGKDTSPIRSYQGGMIFILEGKILEERGLTEQSDSKVPLSMACLYNNSQAVLGSCRKVHCPAGQLRQTDGRCFFPSETWNVNQIFIIVKLRYLNHDDMVLQMYQERGGQILIEKLLENSPWQKHWEIAAIWHSEQMDGWDFQSEMAVGLKTGIVRSKRVFNDVIKALGKQWTITLNGTQVIFEQSFLEFTLLYMGSSSKPLWMRYKEDGYHRNFTLIPSTWTRLDRLMESSSGRIDLKKTLICQQVSLNKGEFDLIENKKVLKIKSTGNFLFDKEFDLVPDKRGDLVPRVCLSDTPFVIRPEVNWSNGGSYTWSRLVLIGYIAVSIEMCLRHI